MAVFRGIDFPFRKGEQSFPEKAEDSALIRASIRQIMLTGRGERVMRPSFGAGVFSFVFEDAGSELDTVIQADIADAINRWEPRVSLSDVRTSSDDTSILVEVYYVVNLTNEEDSVAVQLALP